MKHTWKKLGGLVSIGVLALSLSACGSDEEGINATVMENLYMTTTGTVETLVAYDAATMEQAIEENPGMDDFTKAAFTSWMDSQEELGAYVGYEDVAPEDAVKKDGTNYVVELDGTFENGAAEIEMVYDMKMQPESIGFSKVYTTAEKLQSAALNTVVGLGTVFIILIFLTFVISLLKYVPAWVDSFGKKKNQEPAPVPVPAAPAPVQSEEEEELADDGALVAVIAAAIAASENMSPDGFVVRSIRKSKKSNWR